MSQATIKLFANGEFYDVTDRVYRADKVHDSLGDGKSFMIPQWSLTLDNNDGWYSRIYKPDLEPFTVYVRVAKGTQILFTGYATSRIPTRDYAKRTVNFQFDGIYGMLRKTTIAYDFGSRIRRGWTKPVSGQLGKFTFGRTVDDQNYLWLQKPVVLDLTDTEKRYLGLDGMYWVDHQNHRDKNK